MKDTLIDSFVDVVSRFPKKEALLFREGHHFESLSYEEIWKYAEKLASFLKTKGVREGDRIVVVSENRPEWVITDIASLILGAILVPIHSVLASAQIESIVREVEPSVVFVSDQGTLAKVLEFDGTVKAKYPFVYFETDIESDNPLIISKRLFLFKDEVYARKFEPEIEPIKHKPERVVTIIYTSGTTGKFKGVELTNQNFISNIEGVLSLIEVTEADKFLSILPLSHIFERTVGYYIALLRGATTAYVEDPTKLAQIAEVEKPTIIIAVPRLFEKVYQAVRDKAAASIVKNLVFRAGLYAGKHYSKKSIGYRLAEAVVFKKIKAAFGGQVRFFVSGAASLQKEIGEFFDALDIPVVEGYGLTETSPIVATNTLKKRRYGTVGQVLPNLKVKIQKGELLVKGPSVFKKYYKNPEKTKEAFTGDGWFKTGDLVELSTDGFLKILAREKEILALTTGKKVSPAIIEEKLELSPLVAQAFVFGDSKKHIGALIVPEKSKIIGLTKPQLTKKLQSEADIYLNKYVSSYEQIKKIVIIKKPFTVENGLLTPSMKLRRKEIMAKYASEIDSVYVD